jgi:hypothetical protein
VVAQIINALPSRKIFRDMNELDTCLNMMQNKVMEEGQKGLLSNPEERRKEGDAWFRTRLHRGFVFPKVPISASAFVLQKDLPLFPAPSRSGDKIL